MAFDVVCGNLYLWADVEATAPPEAVGLGCGWRLESRSSRPQDGGICEYRGYLAGRRLWGSFLWREAAGRYDLPRFDGAVSSAASRALRDAMKAAAPRRRYPASVSGIAMLWLSRGGFEATSLQRALLCPHRAPGDRAGRREDAPLGMPGRRRQPWSPEPRYRRWRGRQPSA